MEDVQTKKITMELKKKPCHGNGLAKGYGCGKESYKRKYGICDSCLYDWYTTNEVGKIMFERLKIKNKKKSDNAFKSDLRQKLKTLSDYEAEAKKVFQKYIRLRDEGLNCISCNNPNPKDWSGGHYFPAGVYSGLIFDERNCHAQCNSYCNMYLSGNLSAYRIGLVNRYGKEFVEGLEADSIIKRNYKYTKYELIEIKKKYEAKIKELNG